MSSKKYTVLSEHNQKLEKDGIVHISMPPILTCPCSGKCKEYCYAQVGLQSWKPAKNFRLRNLDLFLNHPDEFEKVAKEDIHGSGRRIIRWLDSGDIMNQAFLKMMVRVAENFPDIKFYAYTKSISIVINFGWENLPKNLKLIQSYGGLEDRLIDPSRPFARVFADEASIPTDYVKASHSDYRAATDATRIGIAVHGIRRKKFK